MKQILSLLLFLSVILTIFGCHSGDSSKISSRPNGDDGNGSISGIVYAVLPAKANENKKQVYYFRGIDISAKRVDSGGSGTFSTVSKTDGIYSIEQLKNGRYDLSATLVYEGKTYTGSLKGVTVVNGNPTYMVNVMVFDQDDSMTISGKVTNGISNVNGATVNLEVSLPMYSGIFEEERDFIDHYQLNHPHSERLDECYNGIVISALSDQSGNYSFTVPKGDGDIFYYLSARYKTTFVSEISLGFLTESLHGKMADIPIDDSTAVQLPTQMITLLVAYTMNDNHKTDLSRSSTSTAKQIDTGKLLEIYAKAKGFNGKQLEKVKKIVSNRKNVAAPISKSGGSRGAADNYSLEIDVMWEEAANIGTFSYIYGYTIGRGLERNGTFYRLGDVNDPFITIFYDIDPEITLGTTYHYMVQAFGAHDEKSQNSISKEISNLNVLNIIVDSNNIVHWDNIAEAKSYTVIAYKGKEGSDELPNLGVEYLRSTVLSQYTNSYDLKTNSWDVIGKYSGPLSTGTYWVCVIASTEGITGNSTQDILKISYSGFTKFVVE